MIVRNVAVVFAFDLRRGCSKHVDVHWAVRSIALRGADVAAHVSSNVRTWIAGIRSIAVWR